MGENDSSWEGRIVVEKAKTFQDVLIWQKAHQWVLNIYRYTDSFPDRERFGLTSQLRRAAYSVPANFAEGFRKKSKPEKLRYYNIAQGSLSESHYFLILANDLGYGDSFKLIADLLGIDVMLNTYMRKMGEGGRE